MSERPNILWIVFDTARADALEPYGAPAGSSPTVADLARRGLALPDMRSTACWTLPAHVSMFAGGLPRQLGFANQAGLNPYLARPIVEGLLERSIVELLRRSGYRTGAITTNAWVSRHSGFAVGFERFVDHVRGRQRQMASPQLRRRVEWLAAAARARADDGAADAERHLRHWIASLPAEPFFWFVNLVECHSPYLPPKPFAELTLPERVRAAHEASTLLTMGALWRACATGEIPREDALERMRSGYRGAIRYMDAWLGRVLECLEGAGVLDDTLVIVSSDHGENFGEGRLVGHGFSLDERLIKVPFVAAGPGAEALRGARSLLELPIRLAEIAGVGDHPYERAEVPPLPVAQFDSPAPPPDDPRTQDAIDLWDLDEAAIERLTTPLTAVVDGNLKMVLRGREETFHDLDADPLELAPLTAVDLDAEAVHRLRAAATHPAAEAREAGLITPPAAPAVTDDDEMVADLEDRMRLLGYL